MASPSSSIRSSVCRSNAVEPSDGHVSVDLQGSSLAAAAESSSASASKTSSPLCTCAVVRVAVAASILCFLAAVGCVYSSLRWQAELSSVRTEISSQAARHALELEKVQGELARHADQLEELRRAAKKPCRTAAEPAPAEAASEVVDEANSAVQLESEKDVETSVAKVARDEEEHFRRLSEELYDKHRRLNVYMNIKTSATMEKNSGCVTVDLSAGAVTLALSTLACNSLHCPSCFIVSNAHATNKLTLTGCSSGYVSDTHKIGTTTGWTNAMMTLLFINADAATPAIVNDGHGDNLISKASSAEAFCWTSGNNKLHFPSFHFTELAVAGASTLSGDLTVNGATTLGDATGDTVTIKGNVVGDGTANPSFDYSGSTGTFKTGTGTVTVGGAAVFSSNARFDGDVTLGNAKADTITFKGDVAADNTENPDIDFSGSSGLFKSSTGAATMGGAATFSSNVQIDGNAEIQGTTTLGNQKTDTITIKADVVSDATTDPKFDLSASAGQFKTSTGQNTFAGNMVTSGTVSASFNGAVTLGDQKTDGIVFKGSVTADGVTKPDFDFSNSNTGAFTTSGGSVTIGGAATFSSNLRVDGNVDFRGETILGNQAADTVTIKGHVTGDATQNPNFDFSGSTGTFLTSTGANTIGGDTTHSGTTTMTGALTLNAGATMGAAKGDTITFKGDVKGSNTNNVLDFSASSGAFKPPGGAATMSGATRFDSGVDFRGDVTLGNQKADAITFKGDVTADGTTNPDIDFSGSSGNFLTTGGTITFSGATTFSNTLTAAGNLVAQGAVTLGNQATDSILIVGAVTADGTANPSIDLSGSSGAFKTTTGVSTVKGNLVAEGSTSLEGTMTLGNQKADTILIKGDLATSGATDPDIDFTASGGQCSFNQGVCSR